MLSKIFSSFFNLNTRHWYKNDDDIWRKKNIQGNVNIFNDTRIKLLVFDRIVTVLLRGFIFFLLIQIQLWQYIIQADHTMRFDRVYIVWKIIYQIYCYAFKILKNITVFLIILALIMYKKILTNYDKIYLLTYYFWILLFLLIFIFNVWSISILICIDSLSFRVQE